MAGIDPKKLRAGLEGDSDKINASGYESKLGLINDANTVSDDVIELHSEKAPGCVLIGAGVRTVSEYTLLLESQLIPSINIHPKRKYVLTQDHLVR